MTFADPENTPDDDEDLGLEPDDAVFDDYATELAAAAEAFGQPDEEAAG